MNPYSSGGAPTTPPPTDDPNPTRYIPPQEGAAGYAPETPRPETPRAEGQTPPYGAAPSTGGYAQPQYSNYGQVANTTQPYKPRAKSDRDRTILALALIGGGALFLLDQTGLFPSFGEMVLLLIGGIFMYAYFTTRPGYRIGFLIPGSILLGIGVGQVLQGFGPVDVLFGGSITAITLGLGFCMIWFFERAHWWALIPGGVILLGGLSSMLKLFALWPLVLIGLGAYLLYEQARKRPR